MPANEQMVSDLLQPASHPASANRGWVQTPSGTGCHSPMAQQTLCHPKAFPALVGHLSSLAVTITTEHAAKSTALRGGGKDMIRDSILAI